ncbi:dash complex subunit dam1 [Lipomyces kononenkoae]|uniref:Dash complex subunit dam1 n=1 Tax=Lipomyces kononenkoae TaxID=34357 RepID=A0ACC3T8I9_LIPKO
MSVQRSRRASRPTTPLRRSVSRPGHTLASSGLYSTFPLEALKPQLAELSDSLADLDTNFQYLEIMHENLARFTESFAAFLYGLEVNAWCVDFHEAPTIESFERCHEQESLTNQFDPEINSQGLAKNNDLPVAEQIAVVPASSPRNTQNSATRHANSLPKPGTKPTKETTKSRLQSRSLAGRTSRSIPMSSRFR